MMNYLKASWLGKWYDEQGYDGHVPDSNTITIFFTIYHLIKN